MFYYTYCITFLSGNLKDKKYFGRRKSKVEPILDIKYKGSGVIPKSYFKQNKNRTDYSKEILGVYNSLDELIEAEQKLLNEHVGKEYCVNFNNNSIGGGCNKNRIAIHKDKIAYYVYESELQHYLNLGFEIGRGKTEISPPNKGKKMDNEFNKKVTEGLKQKWKDNDYREKITNSLKNNKRAQGHTMPDESKQIISKKNKEYYKNNKHPFQGKHHTEETRKRISENRKGKPNWLLGKNLPDWCKKNLSERLTGTKLMTNGVINKYIKYEEIDKYKENGWVIGKYQKIQYNQG